MADFTSKNNTGEFDIPVPSKGITSDSYYALHVILQGSIIPYEMKKCCKKYKKGKRCKKCPNN
jgi:hypothetical protein